MIILIIECSKSTCNSLVYWTSKHTWQRVSNDILTITIQWIICIFSKINERINCQKWVCAVCVANCGKEYYYREENRNESPSIRWPFPSHFFDSPLYLSRSLSFLCAFLLSGSPRSPFLFNSSTSTISRRLHLYRSYLFNAHWKFMFDFIPSEWKRNALHSCVFCNFFSFLFCASIEYELSFRLDELHFHEVIYEPESIGSFYVKYISKTMRTFHEMCHITLFHRSNVRETENWKYSIQPKAMEVVCVCAAKIVGNKLARKRKKDRKSRIMKKYFPVQICFVRDEIARGRKRCEFYVQQKYYYRKKNRNRRLFYWLRLTKWSKTKSTQHRMRWLLFTLPNLLDFRSFVVYVLKSLYCYFMFSSNTNGLKFVELNECLQKPLFSNWLEIAVVLYDVGKMSLTSILCLGGLSKQTVAFQWAYLIADAKNHSVDWFRCFRMTRSMYTLEYSRFSSHFPLSHELIFFLLFTAIVLNCQSLYT